MDEQDQQVEQGDEGGYGGGEAEQGYEPGGFDASDPQAMADLHAVIEENPELGESEQAAAFALEAATRYAEHLGYPGLSTDPRFVEVAYHAAGGQAGVAAANPPDPVDVIMRGGKGGLGGSVLDGI